MGSTYAGLYFALSPWVSVAIGLIGIGLLVTGLRRKPQ